MFSKTKGNPVQRTKGKYENNVSPNREYQLRYKNYKEGTKWILELKNMVAEIRISPEGSTEDLNSQKKGSVNLKINLPRLSSLDSRKNKKI